MRSILVCPDDFLWRLLADADPSHFDVLHIVEEPRARARIAQRGGAVLVGDLERPSLYGRAFRTGHEPVLLAVERARQPRITAAIRRVAPDAPVVTLGDSLDAFAERILDPALERALTRLRVERIRAHFARAARVLILMQDDPDPDAIASALALKTVLGRSRTAATLATFGTITRAENRAMTRVLDIPVEAIKPRALEEYDMLAVVDAQPSFFEERIERVDFVVDHHPEETPVRAALKDIRPSYGATATILTEYLRAIDAKVPQRLATALLYGIKADTQHLERGATRADMDAFAFVHGLANHSALRRIERPELPDEALDVLARGIENRQVVNGVVFAHLGPVAYPELIAQFADFFLQVEGVEWSVVSGTVHGELHVSVRNVGYVRAAGEVVRQAFGDLGGAGGHRSMAKAVIRLRDWRARQGAATSRALAQGIVSRFTRALRG
ncbi:MAG TPA: bifunctional oligoribonuclease/PAP phosphatase NrnA [Methylomirabilota bacterium]|nr:bifunctional oligoribonuclease/PAP phosphatase NrnA [Methylomirabilota bacterium]